MRVPWTRQPPGFTRLDLSHPLAKGIVSGIDARGWSLVGKGTSRAGTVNSTAPRPGGVALIGNNAGLISEQFTSGTPIDYPFTVVAYMSRITRTANNNFAAGLGNNGGNQVAVFQLSTSGGASNRFLYRNVNGGNSPATNYNVNASTSSDVPVVLSATIKGVTNADIDLYWNGVNDTGTGLNSPTSGTPAFDRFAIGGVDRSADGFADTGNDVLFAFVTSKGWSAADHLAFAKNPWQIFRPIVVPAKAPASGSSGTVDYTNANDTSSASGTTTVVGTSTATNANDTSSASGTTTVVGTSSTTNANDTSSASGTTTVTGTVNYTNANDTSAASGTAGATTGTVDYTNANDTATASGWAGTVSGTVDYANNDDTSSAEGAIPRTRRGAAKPLRKGYIIRGKKYFLTDDELAIMVALELETIKRSDIKVPTKGRIKPIPAATFQMVKAVAKKMDELAEIGALEDDDEEEELLSMLL